MESQSPGQPIYHVGSIPNTTPRSPRVVPDPVVVYGDFNENESLYPNYKKGIAKMLGAVQLACGMLCMLLNLGMAFVDYNQAWHIGAGWWASPFIISAGSFALSSSKIVNKLTVHATLWLSLISSFLTIAVIVQGTMSLLLGRVCGRDCNFSSGPEIAHYALSSFFMISGIMEFCASIIQFVIGCQVVCVTPRRQLPFDTTFSQQFDYTNSAFPPPPPPYEVESFPENLSFSSPTADGATSTTNLYLPTYEESIKK